MTDNENPDETVRLYNRRDVVTAAALAGAGSIGIYTMAGAVSADPQGTYPQSGDDPLLKIRADRIRLIGRTSDPSSPDNGTIWYRSDL